MVISGQVRLLICFVSMSLWILLAKRKEECFPVGIFVPPICRMLGDGDGLWSNPSPLLIFFFFLYYHGSLSEPCSTTKSVYNVTCYYCIFKLL